MLSFLVPSRDDYFRVEGLLKPVREDIRPVFHSRTAPPSNWWIPTILFDPNVITSQPIPTINHNGTKLTSLGIDTNFINDVFIQTRLRGSVVDNKNINNVITTIKSNTQRSYVPYNPDVAQSVAPITTYINV